MPPRTSPADIDATLRTIARAQLGLVTVAQAARRGVDRSALWRRQNAGALVAMYPGVLRLAAVGPSIAQTILAACLAVQASTIAATSAGVVHQMPVGAFTTPVLSVPPTSSARTPGIVTVRNNVRLPTQWWHGARVATPAATLLMLPRFVDAPVVERCLDHCLVHRLTTVAVVDQLLHRLPHQAVIGRQLLRELLAERATGLKHRSDLEGQVGRWLTAAGLGGWQANYLAPVGGGETVEVDFAWPHAKVALEVSPFFTHGSKAAQERDAVRRRQLIGQQWRIVEATDPDLESQQAFATTVECLLHLLHPASTEVPRALGRAGRDLLHAERAAS